MNGVSPEWQRLLVFLADSGRFLIGASDDEGELVSRNDPVVRELDAPPERIDAAVRHLVRLDLLEQTDDATIRLTKRGLDKVDRTYREEVAASEAESADSEPPVVRIGTLVVSLLGMYLTAVFRLDVSSLAVFFCCSSARSRFSRRSERHSGRTKRAYEADCWSR